MYVINLIKGVGDTEIRQASEVNELVDLVDVGTHKAAYIFDTSNQVIWRYVNLEFEAANESFKVPEVLSFVGEPV